MNAAKPIARMIDVEIPGEDVLAEVQGLVRQMIAMNEILRDRRRASIRLVMNPDRMVIREAQRTFTYLNLYGYLTDAVIVNRVFPPDVADTYFGAWREKQGENLELVREGFDPVPVLTAHYFEEEVLGARMLDRLGGELFADTDPAAVMHTELAHRLTSDEGQTVLSISVPFAERDELTLKKVGQELIVGAGREKRMIILPAALARHSPVGAKLEDGRLRIRFDDGARDDGAASGPEGAATTSTASTGEPGAVRA
jgi:arsenite-transporting ATPase